MKKFKKNKKKIKKNRINESQYWMFSPENQNIINIKPQRSLIASIKRTIRIRKRLIYQIIIPRCRDDEILFGTKNKPIHNILVSFEDSLWMIFIIHAPHRNSEIKTYRGNANFVFTFGAPFYIIDSSQILNIHFFSTFIVIFRKFPNLYYFFFFYYFF